MEQNLDTAPHVVPRINLYNERKQAEKQASEQAKYLQRKDVFATQR